MTGPWHLIARYRWTLAWVTYIAYLILVFNLRTHW